MSNITVHKNLLRQRKRNRLRYSYVSIYKVTRHYGGPEEGGWWYDWYDRVTTFPRRVRGVRLEEFTKRLKKEMPQLDAKPAKRYRANGGTDWVICYEDYPGECQSKQRPHYE